MPNCDVSRHKLLERPKKIAPHFLPRFQRMIRHFSILRVNPAENPTGFLTELPVFSLQDIKNGFLKATGGQSQVFWLFL
ncbi:MAG: hypothetical protein MR681_02810 [Prevotella sp.]|nr:hypothetical protein [Prevotella sp.]